METIKNEFPPYVEFDEDGFYRRKIICNPDVYDKILTLVKADDIIVLKHHMIEKGNYLMTKDIDRRFDDVDLKMKQDSDTLITCMVSAHPNFY